MRLPSRSPALSLALGALLLAACGDDDNPPVGSDAGTDALDVNVQDTADDTGADAALCLTGAPACARNSDCVGTGIDNAVCDDSGCCVEGEETLEPCRSHLAACESVDQSTDQYFCDADAGLCVQFCDSSTAEDTQSADCPLNSYCFEAFEENPAAPDQLLGLCFPGDCDTNIFDPDACDGVDTCVPIGNEASYCFPAGTTQEGEACGTNDDGTPLCSTGLRCVEGTCVAPCNRRDGDAGCTEDGDSCLAAFDVTPRNQPGLCGVECTPFSTGECGDEVCAPILGRFGVNVWMCQEGPGADVTVVGVGEDCTSDDVVCDEGAICAGNGDDTASCVEICDPLGEVGMGCGGDEPGEEIFGELPEIAASDYMSQAVGDVSAQLRSFTTGDLIAGFTLSFQAESVSSVVVASATDIVTVPDLAAGDTIDQPGIRAVHAAAGADAVDVDLLWDVVLEEGDAFDGEWAAGAEYTFGDLTDIGSDADTLYTTFITDDGAVTVADTDSALAADTFGLRVFNVADAVDVYIDCSSISPLDTVADCDGDTPVMENVPAGDFDDAGAFLEVGTGLVGASVYAIPTGASPLTATDVFSGEVPAVDAGDFAQLILVPSTLGYDGTFETLAFPAAGNYGVTITNLGAETAIEVSTPLATGLEFGNSSEGESSFFTAVPANGTYMVAVGDAVSDGIRLDDAVATVYVYASGEGVDFFVDTTEPTAPATGEGSLRLVHLAEGAGSVNVTAVGESAQVCAPSAIDGLGLCNEGCDPFPRTPGEYGCEADGNTCIPFVARDDRPVEPQGICEEDEGTAAAGESCSNEGFLGGDCQDFAVCLSLEEGGAASCLPLCEPFAEGACAQFDDFSTCSGVPPLLGQLNFSFCIDAQAGAIGDRCTELGGPCAADSSLCIDFGAGGTCSQVCRAGFDDCADGTTCQTGQLDPSVVPSYMGLCQ